MLETERLQLETEPKALTIPVGDGYQPDPDEGELWPLETGTDR